MTARDRELRQLAADIQEYEAVEDSFLAKSFTDLLVILDVRDEDVPAEIETRLAEHGLRGADEVYGEDGGSFTGEVDGAARHHFVDVQTRGAHHSYIVE